MRGANRFTADGGCATQAVVASAGPSCYDGIGTFHRPRTPALCLSRSTTRDASDDEFSRRRSQARLDSLPLGHLHSVVLRHHDQLCGSPDIRPFGPQAHGRIPLDGEQFQLHHQRFHAGLRHQLRGRGTHHGLDRRTKGLSAGRGHLERRGHGPRLGAPAGLHRLALVTDGVAGSPAGRPDAAGGFRGRIQRGPLRPGVGRRGQFPGRHQNRRPLASQERAGAIDRTLQCRQQRGRDPGRLPGAADRRGVGLGLARRLLCHRGLGLSVAAVLVGDVRFARTASPRLAGRIGSHPQRSARPAGPHLLVPLAGISPDVGLHGRHVSHRAGSGGSTCIGRRNFSRTTTASTWRRCFGRCCSST